MHRLVISLVALWLVGGIAWAAPQVVGTSYFADTPFPQFMDMWHEGWSLKDDQGNKLIYARPDMPLGGYLFVYYKNTGQQEIKLTDVMLEGVKLSEGLGVTEKPEKAEVQYGASVLLSKLPKAQTDLLESAGRPLWWKVDPLVLSAGAIGKVVIRLKRDPKPGAVKVGLVSEQGTTEATVEVGKKQPRFATIAFATDLKHVYLYARHPRGAGIKPNRILLDGKDVTKSCRIVSDPTLGLVPVVLTLPQPLGWMSYHHFTASYRDGTAAMAGIRAWAPDFVYGMWGASLKGGDTSEALAKRYLTDWAEHNVNCHMGMSSGPAHDYFSSDEGWDLTERLGIGRMITWPKPGRRPVFFFLMDEPDAHDAATRELKAADRLGSLAQYLVTWVDVLRKRGPETPGLLNIDNTYMPENWYVYHQLPDIPCIDPYFPEQLDYAFNGHPEGLPLAEKACSYVWAVSSISQSSCQPKPLHVILCSTKYYSQDRTYEGRFPTPEEECLQMHYAIAAGAKSISHWWFSPDTYCRGTGADDPAARALWNEIGLLGAQMRTAGPLITRSCPVPMNLTTTPGLWARALLSGDDTLLIVVANDTIISKREGTEVKPLEMAKVTFPIPYWMIRGDEFEITPEGIKDVVPELEAGHETRTGRWVPGTAVFTFDLGTVEVARLLVLSSNRKLRGKLEKLYQEKFAANVAKLKAAKP